MKCEQCPLKNCVRSCEGEKVNHLCTQDKFIQLFEKISLTSECEVNNAYPPATTMARNFLTSSINHLIHGAKNVTQEEAERRLDICKGCDRFDHYWNSCRECGCYMPEKVKWATSYCPLRIEEFPQGKWQAAPEVISPSGEPSKCCGG